VFILFSKLSQETFNERSKKSPINIMMIPAIRRMVSMCSLIAKPNSPTPAPSIVKIRLKPSTKLKEWRKMTRRCLPAAAVTELPAIVAKYTGIRGRQQGVKKDSSPALKAMIMDTSFITAISLADLIFNIKLPNKYS
jgi:hypothetical protein